MRRFLNVALESYEGAPLGDESISMEEEALMIDEADQSAAEVAQDLGDAERIVQVSESLEDLAVVAGSKEELSPQEAALMENSGQMAVAGTDIEPDEIVPAMESFLVDGKISGKLAMENFREKARTMWENIKRILKEIWAKIEAFFYKIFGTIPARRRALKALAARVEATNALTREHPKFTIGGNRYMFTGSTPLKGEQAYAGALKEFCDTAKWVYNGYVDSLKATGDAVAKALEEFDPAEPTKATHGLAEKLHSVGRAKVPGATGASGSRYPKYDVEKGHDLLGGVSLFTLRVKKSEGNDPMALLDRAAQAQVVLAPSSEKAKAQETSIEFQTFSQTAAENMIKELDALLDEMEKYQRGKAKGEIQKIKSKIESASGKAETSATKAKGSEEQSDMAALPHYRALIKFNVAYARWVESPTIAFTKLAFGVISTTQVLIDRSMSQYK